MSDRYSFADDLAQRLTVAHQFPDRCGVEHYPPAVPWDVARTTTLARRPGPAAALNPRRIDPVSIRERRRVKETTHV